MVKRVRVNGVIHQFPDEATDTMIAQALGVGLPEDHPESTQSSQAQSQTASEDSVGMRLGKDALAGTADFGHQLLNLPYNIGKFASNNLGGNGQKTLASQVGLTAEDIPHQQNYDFGQLLGANAPSDKVMQNIISILPSLLAPEAELGQVGNAISSIPKIGNFLKKGAETGVSQGLYAGAQALQDNPNNVGSSALKGGAIAAPFGAFGQMMKEANPVVRQLGKYLTAGGAAYGGHKIAQSIGIPGTDIPASLLSGYLSTKGVNPQRAAEVKLLGDINLTPEIQQRLDAAKRLNLDYLTPAEATNSPFEAAKQGRIGQTSEGSKLLYDKGSNRVQSEENSINNLLDTIYDAKELSPKKKAAYEETMSQTLPEEFIKKHSGNKIIEDAEKDLNSDPVYKEALKDTPRNTVEYWDHIKRILGDSEQTAKRGASPKNYRASVIADSRRDMVKDMDEIFPRYKEARNIAERQFTRQKLEKSFDKTDVNGTNFYKALKSNKQFNEIMGKLDGFPEAKQKLMDMRLLFKDLIPGDPSIRTAAAMKRTSMWNPRELIAGIEGKLNEVFGSKHDVEAVKLMTDPDWASKIGNAKKPMMREKLIGELVKVLGKAGGQYNAQ